MSGAHAAFRRRQVDARSCSRTQIGQPNIGHLRRKVVSMHRPRDGPMAARAPDAGAYRSGPPRLRRAKAIKCPGGYPRHSRSRLRRRGHDAIGPNTSPDATAFLARPWSGEGLARVSIRAPGCRQARSIGAFVLWPSIGHREPACRVGACDGRARLHARLAADTGSRYCAQPVVWSQHNPQGERQRALGAYPWGRAQRAVVREPWARPVSRTPDRIAPCRSIMDAIALPTRSAATSISRSPTWA